MRRLYYIFGLVLTTCSILPSAMADVDRSCEPGWFGDSYSWFSDCWLWVQSEAQIIGAEQIEVRNLTWGTVYQNGVSVATPSAHAYAYEYIGLTQTQPGVYVMNAYAMARLLAYKYSSSGQGATWNPLCAKGTYSYYQFGTGWIYDPSFDFEDCSYNLSTE